MSHQANSVKSIFYALIANGAIAIAKTVAAVITGSGSMMAESIHSFADCGNQLLLLLGIKRAKRPPSSEYPLGYGKEIYFWSFVVALILFTLGGMFSVYEGIHKFQHPEALSSPYIAIAVLVFAIAAESASLYGCLLEVNKTRGDQSLWQWFRESRQSALIVVFGEDIAALAGLTIALVAIALTMITGNPLYDACGSIAIGILLVIIAIMIGREVKALLIGQGVDGRTREAMLRFLMQREELDQVFNLLTLQLGDDVMVAVKAKMVDTQSSDELIRAINNCEAAFREAFPQVLWLFFEPDLTD
jgi:cation diffusion facilitator family transporter